MGRRCQRGVASVVKVEQTAPEAAMSVCLRARAGEHRARSDEEVPSDRLGEDNRAEDDGDDGCR
jgi:hypothetical protein